MKLVATSNRIAPRRCRTLIRAALPKEQRKERVSLSLSAVLKDVGFDPSRIEIEE